MVGSGSEGVVFGGSDMTCGVVEFWREEGHTHVTRARTSICM